MTMKSGFQLLRTRGLHESIDIDVLEKRYQLTLPPKYRLFCEIFILGDESLIIDQYTASGNANDLRHCSFYTYAPNREVRFAGFNALEKVFEYSQNVDEWIDKKLLPIGHVGFNGAILLGTQASEQDKVVLHDFDRSPEYTILADDIFQFMKGVVLEPISEADLVKGATFSRLYKNWGEDFWRVRGE
jgi:hypothetical protein